MCNATRVETEMSQCQVPMGIQDARWFRVNRTLSKANEGLLIMQMFQEAQVLAPDSAARAK